jgi:hypothetical protein
LSKQRHEKHRQQKFDEEKEFKVARIALAVALGVAGAITGGLAWAGYLGFGIAGSELGAIALGGSVGLGVGDARGGLFVGQIKKEEEHETEYSRN